MLIRRTLSFTLAFALVALAGCDFLGEGDSENEQIVVQTESQRYQPSDTVQVSVRNLSEETLYTNFCGPRFAGYVVQRFEGVRWKEYTAQICPAIYLSGPEAAAAPSETFSFNVGIRDEGRYRMRLRYRLGAKDAQKRNAYSNVFIVE